MRVLFIANRSEFGGAPKCMMELIELLKNRYGVEIEVVTHGDHAIGEFCRARNITYYAVGHIPFAVGKGSTGFRRGIKTILMPYYFWNSKIKNRKALQKAAEKIDFSGIDIIHTNSNRDCLGAMLSKKYGIPHVWHLREFGKEDYDIRYLIPDYIKFMNQNTDFFIAISEAVKRVWLSKGIEKNKMIRIYDGIHMPEPYVYKAAQEYRNRLKSGLSIRFAYLGIVCPGKGQFDAIKALALLEKDISSHIHIDFWGDCCSLPEYVKDMKRFAAENGVLDSISFRGFTDQIWEKLSEYDAALVCSRSEAFGRITPEYMSIGLQVVASDTGANPELIESGVSGYVYHHGDLQDLARYLRKIYFSTKEERMAMSVKSMERAQLYTDMVHADNVYKFYCRIMSDRWQTMQSEENL